MADYKRIIKNVAFIVLVPSIVVVGFYATKYSVNAFKKYKAKKLENEQEKSEVDATEEKTTPKNQEYGKLPKQETKVISINREIESTELENQKIKEA